jgi:OmpA-OmpF porin, OOP family
MSIKTITVAAILFLPVVVTAQTVPETKVTSQDLVCQLSGDCLGSTSTPAVAPPSRSFSIRRAEPPSRAIPQSAAREPGMKIAPATRRQTVGPTPHRVAASYPAGRVNLSINFVTGSAVLSNSGSELAQTFMQALRSPQLSGKRFMIAGHTDAVGSRALNLSLSRRRAQAFVDYLVAQGASAAQFDVKGFGFDRPLPGIARTADANRRVEVVLLK